MITYIYFALISAALSSTSTINTSGYEATAVSIELSQECQSAIDKAQGIATEIDGACLGTYPGACDDYQHCLRNYRCLVKNGCPQFSDGPTRDFVGTRCNRADHSSEQACRNGDGTCSSHPLAKCFENATNGDCYAICTRAVDWIGYDCFCRIAGTPQPGLSGMYCPDSHIDVNRGVIEYCYAYRVGLDKALKACQDARAKWVAAMNEIYQKCGQRPSDFIKPPQGLNNRLYCDTNQDPNCPPALKATE